MSHQLAKRSNKSNQCESEIYYVIVTRSIIETGYRYNFLYGLLTKTSGLSFGLEQCQDISLTNWALHIADDLSGSFSKKLYFDLGTLTLGPGATENLDYASQSHLLVHDEFGD